MKDRLKAIPWLRVVIEVGIVLMIVGTLWLVGVMYVDHILTRQSWAIISNSLQQQQQHQQQTTTTIPNGDVR